MGAKREALAEKPSRTSNRRNSKRAFTNSVRGQIVAAIGPRATERLLLALGGRHIWIPKAAPHDRSERDRNINRLIDQGLTYAEVARRVGLSLRQVKRVAKGTHR